MFHKKKNTYGNNCFITTVAHLSGKFTESSVRTTIVELMFNGL